MNMPRPRIVLLALAVLLCSDRFIHGQPAPSRTDDMVFKIMVLGPADEIFIWWGHAALIVENTRWNYSRVFDWGIFTYPSDDFLKDFLGGEVRYKSAVEGFSVDDYIAEDRDIAIYTLDLDRAAKETILDYAENNVLPDNCYYDYHEFRDNCSTRIRDIIDMGTGGQLRKLFGEAPGRMSRRQHIRRFTWSQPLADWFLDFLMGGDLDRILTVWEEMFLPVELARSITDFTYTDSSGVERKLVGAVQLRGAVELRNAAKNRPPVLHRPLTTWPVHAMLGALAAVLLCLIKILRKTKPRTGRILWGLSQSLIGLIFGAAGSVLFFGRFFMEYDYIRQNLNLLFLNPLLFAAVPLGILAAIGKPTPTNGRPPTGGKPLWEKCLAVLWTAVFAAGLLSIAIGALPALRQQNQSALGIVLPVALALSLAPGWGKRVMGKIF